MTPDERMYVVLNNPNVKAILRGTIRAEKGGTSLGPLPEGRTPPVVTEFEFRVSEVIPIDPADAIPEVGSIVMLRVPGGVTAEQIVSDEQAPKLSTGNELFVLMADEPDGGPAGGSAPGIVALPNSSMVGLIANDNVDWLGLREPVMTVAARMSATAQRIGTERAKAAAVP
jgi:hypothetical protein